MLCPAEQTFAVSILVLTFVTSDVTGVSQLLVTIRALALALARAQNKHQLQDHGLPQRS